MARSHRYEILCPTSTCHLGHRFYFFGRLEAARAQEVVVQNVAARVPGPCSRVQREMAIRCSFVGLLTGHMAVAGQTI